MFLDHCGRERFNNKIKLRAASIQLYARYYNLEKLQHWPVRLLISKYAGIIYIIARAGLYEFKVHSYDMGQSSRNIIKNFSTVPPQSKLSRLSTSAKPDEVSPRHNERSLTHNQDLKCAEIDKNSIEINIKMPHLEKELGVDEMSEGSIEINATKFKNHQLREGVITRNKVKGLNKIYKNPNIRQLK